MTTTDRRTKADLLEALAGAEKRRQQALDAEAAALGVVEALDVEAKVIAGCVDAIDQFPKPTPRSSSLSGMYMGDDDSARQLDPGDPRIVRVLAYLAARYGLPDPRAQVDQLTDELGRVNADLHRTRAECDQLRFGIQQLQHPDPRF